MTSSPSSMMAMSKGWVGMNAPERETAGQTPSVKTMDTAALTVVGMFWVEKMGSMNMMMLTRISVRTKLRTTAGL